MKNISLETYSKSEKARRTENLKELARLENMTSVFDAQIRNASHHARIEFDKDTLQILLRPSSKSTERLLTYVQYVDSCNRLFQTTIGLFIFCLEFMHEIMNSFALAHSLNVNLQQAKLDDPEFLAWFERGGSN